MLVIGHEHPMVDADTVRGRVSEQEALEVLIVFIGMEEILAGVTPIQDVIDKRRLQLMFSGNGWHGGSLSVRRDSLRKDIPTH